jgi:hypothetical protein
MNVETPALDQAGMKEMDHPTAVRNVDPALHQHGVGFSIAVSDDPIAQTGIRARDLR